jgi:hypothetical protein
MGYRTKKKISFGKNINMFGRGLNCVFVGAVLKNRKE